MKNIVILALFIFASVTAFSQTEAELTEQGQIARKILLNNGVDRHCFSVTNTPQGIFISSRTETNVPVNYLYTSNNQFSKVDYLDGYIIIDYSPVNNSLLTGKYEYAKLSDNMFRKIYSYSLSTKKFTLQFESTKWVLSTPKYSPKYDSFSVDIGDYYHPLTIKVK